MYLHISSSIGFGCLLSDFTLKKWIQLKKKILTPLGKQAFKWSYGGIIWTDESWCFRIIQKLGEQLNLDREPVHKFQTKILVLNLAIPLFTKANQQNCLKLERYLHLGSFYFHTTSIWAQSKTFPVRTQKPSKLKKRSEFVGIGCFNNRLPIKIIISLLHFC